MKQLILILFLSINFLVTSAQIGLPIQQAFLPKKSLVVDYDFSKPSSYTRGSNSLNNIAGTVSGAASIVNSPIFMNSLGFVSLNGTNQYLVTPNLKTYFKALNTIVQKSFTMSLWFYPKGLNGVIVSELDSQTPSAGFHATNIEIVNGFVKYRVWPGTAITTSTAINLNLWYHLAIVYDGSTIKAYLNGVLQGTQTYTRDIPAASQNYAIGATEATNMGTSAYGNFNIAQFKIHQLPLTDKDILQEYESRKNEFDYTIHSPSTNTNPTYWSASSVWSGDAFYANAPEPSVTTGYHLTPWLNAPQGWSAGANDANQYIVLNYDEPAYIKGVVTQGRKNDLNQYVTFAHIETSLSASGPWTRKLVNKSLNVNTTDDVLSLFPAPVFAKYVKLIPTNWNSHITLRMGMLVKKNDFISDNLVLHYNPAMTESFDGTGTSIIDLAGNSLNGTISNVTYSTPYFTFNGTNSQVSIPDNTLLEPGTGNWTIETWIKPTQFTTSSQTVIGKYNNGGLTASISYALRVYNGSIIANFSNGTTGFLSDYYLLTLNNWVQMVYVWDKSNNLLYTYVNGVLKQSKAITISGILNATTNLYLGSYNGGEYPQYFNGQIGIVRLYKKALNASEVLKNFNVNKALYDL
jgi:hypothetical protein